MLRPALAVQPAENIVARLREQHAGWKEALRRFDAEFLLSPGSLTPQEFERRIVELEGKSDDDRIHWILVDLAKDTLLMNTWTRYREVYEIHPAVTRALRRTKLDAQVPGQLFRQLRHINPMFVFTHGLDLTLADGQPGRTVAMVVTGANRKPGESHASVIDTHDPKANGLRAVMFTDVLSDDGTQVIDQDIATFYIRFDGNYTLRELIDITIERDFAWSKTSAPPDETLKRSTLTTLITVAVEHLVYAVSASFEAEIKTRGEMPPAARKKTGKGKAPKPSLIRRVGYRDGAAIEATLLRVAERQKGSGITGRTVAPHMRGAHFHTYWTGPGRETPIVKWLLPTMVNATADDGETVTVHPVKAPRS